MVGMVFRRLFDQGLLVFLIYAYWERNQGEMGFDFCRKELEKIWVAAVWSFDNWASQVH